MSHNPIAVVVGLCPHGLTLTRSLSAAGIKVVALEANTSLPSTRTNSAEIIVVEDINGPSLISSLAALAPTLSESGPPVLFLTNDSMSRTIGENYGKIRDLYKLSWGHCTTTVTSLLDKASIPRRCQEIGLNYPASRVINTRNDLLQAGKELRFPLIFKPDKPVSSYKTLLVHSMKELEEGWSIIQNSIPTIAQEFVEGGEENLKFGALYLNEGVIIARYEGTKLRSNPMGHTTVAQGESSDAINHLSKVFFSGLNISGPVSLEVKRGPDGEYWVIEPTVGRTDFWVGLCIADNVDFPSIEFTQITGCGDSATHSQRDRCIWINEARDPAALLWIIIKYPTLVLKKRVVGVFLRRGDLRPFFAWLGMCIYRFPGRVFRKIVNVARNVTVSTAHKTK